MFFPQAKDRSKVSQDRVKDSQDRAKTSQDQAKTANKVSLESDKTLEVHCLEGRPVHCAAGTRYKTSGETCIIVDCQGLVHD